MRFETPEVVSFKSQDSRDKLRIIFPKEILNKLVDKESKQPVKFDKSSENNEKGLTITKTLPA